MKHTDTSVLARQAARRALLGRRTKTGLPIGSSPASIRAYRNLQYLEGQGVIAPRPQSARVALELSNSNLKRANRKSELQFQRDSKQSIQEVMNGRWLGTQRKPRPERLSAAQQQVVTVRKAKRRAQKAARKINR